MSIWTTEIVQILEGLFAGPRSGTASTVMGVPSVVAFIAVVRFSSGPFGLKMTSWQRSVPSALLTLALPLLALATVRLYVTPLVVHPAAVIKVVVKNVNAGMSEYQTNTGKKGMPDAENMFIPGNCTT